MLLKRAPGADPFATAKTGARSYHRDVAMMFQDPVSSLSPRRTVQALVQANVPIAQQGEGIERRWVVDPAWRETGQATDLGDVIALHLGRQLFAFVGDVSEWYDELLARLRVRR